LDNTIPKKIWFLWLQGFDNAPLEVKECYESWVRLNPGWEVVFMDESDIAAYITVPKWRVAKYVLSELLRINLLAKYGGVWADATCYCVQPLDEWLPAYISAGFFAFERPGPDRMISSWFLAAAPDNYIAAAFRNRVNKYWQEYTGIRLVEGTRWKFLVKKLQDSNPQVWFHPIFTRVLKVHPYFWFHHTFENVYLSDERFRKQWDASPKLSADVATTVFYAGVTNPLTKELKKEIDDKTAPVYKLTWKYDHSLYVPGSIMYYLFNRDN